MTFTSYIKKQENTAGDDTKEMESINDNYDNKYASSTDILEIPSFDGYKLKGKLTVPAGEKYVRKLVIYVNGSGANTYDNKRTGFNYFDIFAEEFSNRGIAFFSYNTRGCDIGNDPPMYVDIDYDEYQTYLPLNSVEDIYYMIKSIKENERLKDCKIYLLGWSEGTIIAPLVAEKYPNMVDGLLLAGYVNQNLKDVLIWQNSGGCSMAWYRDKFKADEQGHIYKQAYEEDPNSVIADILQNITFEELDINKDGYLSEEDFIDRYADVVGYSLNDILSVIERSDDEWIIKNYGSGLISLTSAWFLQHFSLRSNMEVLPELDLPIYIFHGTADQNVDVREVYKIKEKFDSLGKTNLTINVFEHHNHNLNYIDIITNNKIPLGIKSILDTVVNL